MYSEKEKDAGSFDVSITRDNVIDVKDQAGIIEYKTIKNKAGTKKLQ